MSCADRGRTALGEAEATAFGGTDLETEHAVAELSRRAAVVTSGPWWQAAGGLPVTIAAARVSAHSSRARLAGRAVDVRLAPGQRDVATLAHELAHALAGLGHGHDERFRAALVDVVTVLAGAPAASALVAALADFGLAVAVRPWPRPTRAEGEGFVVLGG